MGTSAVTKQKPNYGLTSVGWDNGERKVYNRVRRAVNNLREQMIEQSVLLEAEGNPGLTHVHSNDFKSEPGATPNGSTWGAINPMVVLAANLHYRPTTLDTALAQVAENKRAGAVSTPLILTAGHQNGVWSWIGTVGEHIGEHVGLPIYEKWPGELIEHYNLYMVYQSAYLRGGRSVAEVTRQTGVSGAQITLLKDMYQWDVRAAAFDTTRLRTRNNMLAVYQDEILGRHRKTGAKIFDKCTEFLLNNEQMLTPQIALSWAKLAVDLERMSTGLDNSNIGMVQPGNGVGQPSNTNVQVIVDQKPAATEKTQGDDRDALKEIFAILNKVNTANQKVPDEDSASGSGEANEASATGDNQGVIDLEPVE